MNIYIYTYMYMYIYTIQMYTCIHTKIHANMRASVARPPGVISTNVHTHLQTVYVVCIHTHKHTCLHTLLKVGCMRGQDAGDLR